MRRKRFQRGSVQKRRHGRRDVWVGLWCENGGRRSKVLGRCAQMTKSEALAAMATILQPINAGISGTAGEVWTWQQFIERTFLPWQTRRWKASTAETSEQQIRQLIMPAFPCRVLRTIARDELQAFLDGMAPRYAESVVKHLRFHLSAIFRLAQADGVVTANPAMALVVPRHCKPGRAVTALSEEDVVRYVDALAPRERLIARLAIFEGMRPGEIFSLRWRDISSTAVLIERRVYMGQLDTTKNDKSRLAALSHGTAALIETWRKEATATEPEDFVFASARRSSPLRPENVWKNFMRPLLVPLGLERATFQTLRHTNATLMKKAGADAKVGADQRGHGLGVSLAVYTESDTAQKREAVLKLEAAIEAARPASEAKTA